MRTSLLLLALPISLLFACGGPGTTPTAEVPAVVDSIWDGELSITGSDARFMVCGTGIRYAVVGPGLDTVQKLYANQLSIRGQTMKAWITGHLAEQHAGQHDTAFVAAGIVHIDATLSCPPRPKAMLAGRYEVTLVEPMGTRTMTMDLLLNGEVFNSTLIPGKPLPVEMDGQWGVTGSGEVEVYWPQLDRRARYSVTENTLTLNLPNAERGTAALILRRTGTADRMSGTFGAVARWLVAVGAAQGQAIDSTKLSMATPLGELVTTDGLRNALTDSAVTWFPLNAQQQRVEWPALSSMRDMVSLKRSCDRMPK